MSTSSTTTTTPTFPTLPPTLLLISLKSYFPPTRTLTYLTHLLSPSSSILPLPPTILFALIPDTLTIHPCSTHLSQHYTPSPTTWPLSLGAQDISPFPTYGAYTGFTVAPALASLGVTIVELGHAERRRYVGETDEIVAAKAKAATSAGMVPLVCIGEVARPDMNAPMSASVGNAMRELTPQIESLLDAVPDHAPVVFAYEPVWAIGAERPAGVGYVGAVVGAVREVVRRWGGGKGRKGEVRVVYGGSAGPGLWSGKGVDGKGVEGGEGLARYVDGMFLGRFAHEVEGVRRVVEEVKETVAERERSRNSR